MPFTPAHTAIVLPFLKSRRVSATALVAGAMAPDFEYFLKMSVRSNMSHSIAGIFYFDLPMTIALCFVFHLFVKNNLIDNLPVFLQRRLVGLKSFDFMPYFKRRWLTVTISALIGAASHVLWDSFTHGGRYFARTLDVIKHNYVPFDGVRYPMFYALQQASTAVGLAVLIGYILLMKPDTQSAPSHPNVFYWILLIVLSSIIVLIRFSGNFESVPLGNFVVSCISAVCISLCVAGMMRFPNTTM